jgi:pimeloyl-ACP methyl ester carboxylesterase
MQPMVDMNFIKPQKGLTVRPGENNMVFHHLKKYPHNLEKYLVALSFIFFGLTFAQQPSDEKLDPKTFSSFLGTYKFDSGELITIGRTERRLYYFEPESGKLRGLEKVNETTWNAGPSLLVYTPVEDELTFTKNSNGIVTSLIRKTPNSSKQVALKTDLYKEEEVSFKNKDVTIAGTLLSPSTRGPHPAVVFLHGSGPQDRNGYVSLIRITADYFARNGIATLIYDKRGCGSSTGNWETATFDDLALDAISGMKSLQKRKDIHPDRIGFWGSSQAGWIMAKATTFSKDIAFIVSVSAGGSGFTVAEQELFNVETEMRANDFSDAEIAEVLTSRKLLFDFVRTGEATTYDAALLKARTKERIKDWLTPPSTEIDRNKRDQWFLALDIDFDPVPAWRQYSGPVLAVFGELDSSTPVTQVVPKLSNALAARPNTDFTIKVFPKAHHLILEAKTGSDKELEFLKRYVPGYFTLMLNWIQTRFLAS